MATTSSGLTPLCGSRPKKVFTVSTTFGMRVMPPTSTTSSISAALRPASFNAFWHGPTVFWMRSSTRLSSLARVSFMVRCLGPALSAVMKGRLISVWVVDDNSIFAFSAAEEGVAVGGLHLEHAVADLEDRDVESAAAEVVYGDGLGAGLFVQPVSERRSGRLVDDT